jgi:hypothetical protein
MEEKTGGACSMRSPYAVNRFCAISRLLDDKHFSSTMGQLGATVAGTDPSSTGGHPHFNRKKKGDSK